MQVLSIYFICLKEIVKYNPIILVMKPLIVIPARGGSVRLPKKNIKLLNRKPLIQYTIEAAREVFDDSVICLSTDSEEIVQISEKIGLQVPFIRPKALATNIADTRVYCCMHSNTIKK